jgi:hypothetical protein
MTLHDSGVAFWGPTLKFSRRVPIKACHTIPLAPGGKEGTLLFKGG